MRIRGGLVALAVLCCAAAAHAQDVAPPTTGVTTWAPRFERARQMMMDGEWEKAATELDDLSRDAPTSEDARAAHELLDLARYWQKRDVAFVPRQSLGESNLSSKAIGKRTIDELVTLYATSGAYGAGLGVSLAVMADANDAAAFLIPAIVGAALGVGGVALVDTFGRLKYGQPQAIASGTLLGVGEALLFDAWKAAHDGNACFGSCTPWDGKAYVGIGVATTTLGAVLGGVVGSVFPMTPGRASWVSSTGIWSGVLVACVTGAIAGDSLQGDVLVPTMIGYNAGIVAGVFTAGFVSPSIARVRLLDLGGIAGGLTAMGIYFAAVNRNSPDGAAALGVTGLGVAAGLTTSWLLTMRMSPDRPEPTPNVDVHPIVTPTQGGATLGFAGRF